SIFSVVACPSLTTSHTYSILSSFFFSLPLPHPDLHSFPTRRSSDLSKRTPRSCGSSPPRPGSPRSRPPPPRRSSSRIVRKVAGRSEEHTSELQSRVDLVCRLLLEKKKKIKKELKRVGTTREKNGICT